MYNDENGIELGSNLKMTVNHAAKFFKTVCLGCAMYEGCQKSSWTLIIKDSNVPDFDIHYYISLK